jgi:hypothetical protein
VKITIKFPDKIRPELAASEAHKQIRALAEAGETPVEGFRYPMRFGAAHLGWWKVDER